MMSLEVYSLTREGEKKLRANFRVREFACADGSDPVFLDSELTALLQAVRDHFGRAVSITSGYRTAAHNAALPHAAPYSQHLYGRAADIRVSGVSVDEVADYAESLLPGRGGIGRYSPKAGRPTGWVHLDVRSGKSRWSG